MSRAMYGIIAFSILVVGILLILWAVEIEGPKMKYKDFISEIKDVADRLDKDCVEIQSCIKKCINNEG